MSITNILLLLAFVVVGITVAVRRHCLRLVELVVLLRRLLRRRRLMYTVLHNALVLQFSINYRLVYRLKINPMITYLLGVLLHLAAADIIAATRFAVAIAGAAVAVVLRIGHKIGIILRVCIGIAIEYLINS